MAYYLIGQADKEKDWVITNSEEKAIKIHDKMVDDNPEFGDFHFSTWKEEDPEGYDENYSIENFAVLNIYVEKFEDWNEMISFLKSFNGEEEEE